MIKAVIFDCFGVLLTGIGESRNDQLIDYIKTLGPKYKLGLLSNVSGREGLDRRFNSEELDKLFDTVVASGDVGMVKPDQRIYEMTAEQLGVPPEACVMIDDIQDFCDAAEAIGMRSIRFIDTQQCIADLEALIDRES